VGTTPDQRKAVLRRAARADRRGHAQQLAAELSGEMKGEHGGESGAASGEPGRSAGSAWRDALLDLPELAEATCVAAYLSRGDEPPTEELLAELRRRRVPVLLPVLRADLDLEWSLDDGSRRASAVRPGLQEPAGESLGLHGLEGADVIVVPALAVDTGGVRLGYGGGSYDRALLRARPDALRIALLYDGELSEAPLPEHEHDQRVDAVATPGRGVIRLRARS
jgi:5-formyltetrahydrofolate cyclo-ligase